MINIYNQLTLSKADYPPYAMWVDLTQSAEGLKSKDQVFPRKRNFAFRLLHRNFTKFPACSLSTATSVLTQSLLWSLPCEFLTLPVSYFWIPSNLSISLFSPSLYPLTETEIEVYFYLFCFSGGFWWLYKCIWGWLFSFNLPNLILQMTLGGRFSYSNVYS